jgi:hypothetical protein
MIGGGCSGGSCGAGSFGGGSFCGGISPGLGGSGGRGGSGETACHDLDAGSVVMTLVVQAPRKFDRRDATSDR